VVVAACGDKRVTAAHLALDALIKTIRPRHDDVFVTLGDDIDLKPEGTGRSDDLVSAFSCRAGKEPA
jgi:hypothetical protein